MFCLTRRYPLGRVFFACSMAALFLAQHPALAQVQDTGEGQKNPVINVQEVLGTVDSVLEVVAINGESIEPDPAPMVALGDVITFRVLVENLSENVYQDLQAGLELGRGLRFVDLEWQKNCTASYNQADAAISVDIPELMPGGEETACGYVFDAQVKACQDLDLQVLTDELYASQAVQTSSLPIEITTPDIEYTIRQPEGAPSEPGLHQVQVDILNSGSAPALDFGLKTALDQLPLEVSQVSSGFAYQASNGVFSRSEPIDPGQEVRLGFTLHLDEEDLDALQSAPLSLQPGYASPCGTRFSAPRTAAAWSPKARALTFYTSSARDQAPEPVQSLLARDEPEIMVQVTPKSCRVRDDQTPMQWTMYVVNTGGRTARDVRLEQSLGRDVQFEGSILDGQPVSPHIAADTPGPDTSTLTWELGDMDPAGIQTLEVTALAAQAQAQSGEGYFSSVNVQHRHAQAMSEHMVRDTPRFILPGESIGGEIFEGPGKVHEYFAVSQIYRSNLFRTARNTEDSFATYLTPGIWVAVPASRERIVEIETSSATPGGLAVNPYYPASDRKYQSYLLYSPQYEIYHDRSDENMLTHRADAYFRYNTQNKVSFRILDQFKRTHDSVSSRVFTIDDRYNSNLFHSLLTYDPTQKLRFRLDYSNYLLDYDGDENSRADRMDNSWSAYSFFRLTPSLSVFANYEFADIDYDVKTLNSQEQRGFAGVRWEISRKTKGQIKGGYGVKDFDRSGLSDADSWMAEIQLDHSFSPRTRAVLNAYRRYDESVGELVDRDDLPQSFTSYILSHFVGLSLYYDLTSKIQLNLDGTFFYDEYEDEGQATAFSQREDTEFAISPALKFNFARWLTCDLSYTYTQRDSNYSQFDFEDHAVILRASVYR